MTIVGKLLAVSVIIIMLLCGVIDWVHGKYEKKVEELVSLQATLRENDRKMKEKEAKWKEQNDELTKQHEANVDRLRERIKRLLQSVSTSVPSSAPTGSAQALNGGAKECTIGKEVVDVEGCVLDALQVMEWRQWAMEKGFPISK